MDEQIRRHCFTVLRCPKGVFLGGLEYTGLFSHNHFKFSAQHESNTTSDVTGMFWPRQDRHHMNFGLNQPAGVGFGRLKKQFLLTVREKTNWQCFQIRFKLYITRQNPR